jgi:hypothetical protein
MQLFNALVDLIALDSHGQCFNTCSEPLLTGAFKTIGLKLAFEVEL